MRAEIGKGWAPILRFRFRLVYLSQTFKAVRGHKRKWTPCHLLLPVIFGRFDGPCLENGVRAGSLVNPLLSQRHLSPGHLERHSGRCTWNKIVETSKPVITTSERMESTCDHHDPEDDDSCGSNIYKKRFLCLTLMDDELSHIYT